MKNKPSYWAVVPAAGVGARMRADRPKQYLPLAGSTVIETTLGKLLAQQCFRGIVVAVSSTDPYWAQLSLANDTRIQRAEGGANRADSVLSALQALEGRAEAQDWVLVHDAARPCIHSADIHYLTETLENDAVGGILAVPVHDTLKLNRNGCIEETIDRSRVWRALTPQMFRYGELLDCLQRSLQAGFMITDEASAMEWAGHSPVLVEGRSDNIKITRPEDLALAEFYLEQQCYE